jgi:hypothetical protein
MANVMVFSDLEAVAKQLGEETGKGKDTQVKFLIKAVEGAYHNAIDLVANKHGHEVDDVTKLAEIYVKAQQGSVIFDAKAPNQRKLVSCLRTCVKLGQWPKGGLGEPLATMNNLITMRQKMRTNPAEAKRLDDAANTLLKYARRQIRLDQIVPDAELKEMCFKPVSGQRTAEEIIESARNQLQKLLEGKAAGGTALDQSPLIRAAKNSLTQRLTEIAQARAPKPGQPAKVA